ncbi:hypothetical protein [Pantoea ananatis]|jgi:hypothetical protein|uniref:hypothetical protein n=1 Tax=Pantoea ananas TaxID=553 RepID=UPI0021F75D15|nr:hypothetical protein [Pantoea ananatis]
MLTGLTGALPDALHLPASYARYLWPLSLGAASVLAFTLNRLSAVKSWLCALAVLPFIALMTGWQHWNFPASHAMTFFSKTVAQSCLCSCWRCRFSLLSAINRQRRTITSPAV